MKRDAFAPVVKQSLSDKLAQQIRTMIHRGDYARGDRLPTIMEMARRWGVGHPTIREALKKLETMGVVEIRHGSGVYVSRNEDVLVMASQNYAGTVTKKLLTDLIRARMPLEVQSVADAVNNATPEDILEMKRLLSTARRLVSPERELFSSIAKWGAPLIKEQQVFYYRSIHDDLMRAVESIESYRELLSNALDAHFSAVSQRTNEIMKHLTLLSSIFLPLTFVTGFFGMNFEHLPFASDALMWAGIGACLILPAAMLYWFRSNRWI